MGQSTDAILFYGYCWEDETSKPWEIGKDSEDEDDEDWEDRYARLKGLKRPSRPWEIIEEHSAHWAAERELVAVLPVQIDTHCSFVAVKASKTRAWRGSPMEITSLEVKPEWDAQLREFCQLMGIDVGDQQPRWWLVSDWG